MGETIENRALRLRSRVLASTPELLRAETEAGGGGNGGPLHRHLRQEERFLVQEGQLRVRVGLLGSRVVGPGQQAVVPIGTPHTFRVEGEGARFITEFRPAWKIAEVFQELFALAAEGGLSPRGNPKLSDLALIMARHPDDFFYAPVVPPAVQRALLRPLARRAEQGRR